MSDLQAQYVADVIAKAESRLTEKYFAGIASHVAAVLRSMDARTLLNAYESGTKLPAGSAVMVNGKSLPLTVVHYRDDTYVELTDPRGKVLGLSNMIDQFPALRTACPWTYAM
jgi:hypothetical protein